MNVPSYKTYKLPDKGMLYHVMFHNGMDLIVVGANPVREGDWRKQDIFIFDKKFHVEYRGSFDLIFTVFHSDPKLYVFFIDKVHWGERSSFGALWLEMGGRVKFEGDYIPTDWSRKLCVKARMLRG